MGLGSIGRDRAVVSGEWPVASENKIQTEPDGMEAFFSKLWDILLTLIDPRNLTDPEKFQKALSEEGVYSVVLTAVCFVVFAETGLLFGFLFPGDSLLVVLGVVIEGAQWNVWEFIVPLILAAIFGEMVGYWIGAKAGPAIFNRPDGRIFKQKYLTDSKAYFEKHGGKTIIIARFMPFVRTFVPVVAGAARMNYRTFMIYNVIGAVLWITSMVLFGYYALKAADTFVQEAIGKPDFTFKKHLDKIVIAVVLVSVAPMMLKAWKKWRSRPQGAGPR